MHLNETTEALDPFDQKQSLRCRELQETSFLMKHTFVPFIVSYTTAFWAEFNVPGELGR